MHVPDDCLDLYFDALFCIRFAFHLALFGSHFVGVHCFFVRSSNQTCRYLYRLHWRHSRGYVFTRWNSVGALTSVEDQFLWIGASKEQSSQNSETGADFESLAVFASLFSFMYKSFALDKARCSVEEKDVHFPISTAETFIIHFKRILQWH